MGERIWLVARRVAVADCHARVEIGRLLDRAHAWLAHGQWESWFVDEHRGDE